MMLKEEMRRAIFFFDESISKFSLTLYKKDQYGLETEKAGTLYPPYENRE